MTANGNEVGFKGCRSKLDLHKSLHRIAMSYSLGILRLYPRESLGYVINRTRFVINEHKACHKYLLIKRTFYRGNIKHSGTVTILQSELNTLQELARMNFGRPDILKLNLNAVVCYGNPLEGDVMTVDRLFGIQFTEIPKGMKQGDPNMEIALPFVCTDIKYNS